MALSNEERDKLFETLRTENEIENRAEAIVQLQAELVEETELREKVNDDLTKMTENYTNSQIKFGELLNSIPNTSGKQKDETEKENENEIFGFDKLRG